MKTIDGSDAKKWLFDVALPFWADHGVDKTGKGAWEALGHDGSPLTQRKKRIRVHPRQTYVFAKAATTGHPQFLPVARDLFGYAMQSGFDAKTGRVIDYTDPDGNACGAPHRLYDLAFILLANAAMFEAGALDLVDLDKVHGALDVLKADLGWYNDAAQSGPREQNPHMHLFEATTELFAATGDKVWQDAADRVLDLFKTVFLQNNGTLLEFFDDDWVPVSTGQQIEPGHMFEWIWLLDRYEKVTGKATGVDMQAMFFAALSSQHPDGFFPDVMEPRSQTYRLWPQCEVIKAGLVLQQRAVDLPDTAKPQHLMNCLFDRYLGKPVDGGWSDSFDASGQRVSTDMPSSTLYHIYIALMAFADQDQA